MAEKGFPFSNAEKESSSYGERQLCEEFGCGNRIPEARVDQSPTTRSTTRPGPPRVRPLLTQHCFFTTAH